MQLGNKVQIKGYYQRNGAKPRRGSESFARYDLKQCNLEGFVVGKRTINVRGFTDYDSEDGYTFEPRERVTVLLVAVNMRQCLYVPEDCIEMPDTIGCDWCTPDDEGTYQAIEWQDPNESGNTLTLMFPHAEIQFEFQSSNEYANGEASINFCPMCGRKLNN